MSWQERKFHPSIFHDSSIPIDCPECQNSKLKLALKMLNDLHQKNLQFGIDLLEWMEHGLGHFGASTAVDASPEKRDDEKTKIFASLEAIQRDNEAIRSYLRKNKLDDLLWKSASTPW